MAAQVAPRAALVRQIVRRQMVGIRHGEAGHNELAPVYGNQVYEQFADTTLTVRGMHQARTAIVPEVDMVLVSPLTRALQTAQLMYPRTKTVALECLKELPQHTQICNRRSSRLVLEALFPAVDFTDLRDAEQPWPNAQPAAMYRRHFNDYLDTVPGHRIAVVAHSTWLKLYMTGNAAAEPELRHCFPYKMTNID